MSVSAGELRGEPPPNRSLGAALIVLCQSTQALAYGGIGLFLPLIRRDIVGRFVVVFPGD